MVSLNCFCFSLIWGVGEKALWGPLAAFCWEGGDEGGGARRDLLFCDFNKHRPYSRAGKNAR